MKKYIKYSAIFLVFMTACASSQESSGMPKWIENPSSKYSESLYLSAVGSGSSREEAKKSAIGSLSNIFSVDVKVDRTIIESYTEKKGKDEMDFSHSIELLSESALKSDNKLINTRVGETYFDETTGTFYVLVYINRMNTEPIYLDEIKKNDEVLSKYYSRYEEAEDILRKFIYLRKAIEVSRIGDGLRQVHRILTQLENTPEPPFTTQELSFKLQELSKEIGVKVQARGDRSQEISSFLRKILQDIGFSTGMDNPDLTFSANLDIESLDFERKEEFVHWRLTVDVKNAINGTTMETFTDEGREGHASMKAAENRALRQIEKILQNDFTRELNEFLGKSVQD